MRLNFARYSLGLIVLTMGGCAKTSEPTATTSEAILTAKPAGALGVIQARKEAKDKQDVIVVGRIGGDMKPFIDGIAAFSIVDTELKPCPDEEGCPTPWDYCCDTDKLPERKALVKVVDGSGKPVASDARQLLGVKELSTVTVRGKASRDEAGNLTILATGIFVDAR
jgi:hypothetical protein